MAKSRVVNVASVPKRSPFRYPGGKTWLVPTVRKWLGYAERPRVLYEPFAGGGIVGLTAAFEGLAERVVLVEKDPDVAAVWQTIITKGEGEWLAREIRKFELTASSVRKALGIASDSTRVRAFQTILRNRVQRGGIMAAGAGFMKDGENGRGLASRWYPETLSRRILEISAIRSRLSFIAGDGSECIREHWHERNVAFFIDPPYTIAGARLYKFCNIDHGELLKTIARLSGDFLVTYDDAAEIRNLATRFSLRFDTIPMKNTHHEIQRELLISRDFAWMRKCAAVEQPMLGLALAES